MIPKIIHYCWFGGKDIPRQDKDLINVWTKMHPDFEIKIWNEQNSPMTIPYLKKAASLSNWANMSNYVRLHALYTDGGIYMDTDFQYVKNLEPLLVEKCFAGIENEGEFFYINNAFFGSEKQSSFVKELINDILKLFEGTELANLSSPHLITNRLRSKGLIENKYQILDKVTIFPYDYFYPLPYDMKKDVVNIENYITKNSYAAHLWHGTWKGDEEGNDIYEHSKDELLAIEKSAVWKGQTQNFVNQKHIEVLEQRDLSLNIKLNDLNDYIETQEKEIIQNKEFAIRLEKEKIFLNTLITENKEVKTELAKFVIQFEKFDVSLSKKDEIILEQKNELKQLSLILEKLKQTLAEKNKIDEQQNASFSMQLDTFNTTLSKKDEIILEQKDELNQLSLTIEKLNQTVIDKSKLDEQQNASFSLHFEKLNQTVIDKSKVDEQRYTSFSLQLEMLNTSLIKKDEFIMDQKNELKQLGFSIDSLKQIEDELSIQLNWYRTTYEERSLLGIIKTRIFKK